MAPDVVRAFEAVEFAAKYKKQNGPKGLMGALYNEGYDQGELEAFIFVARALRDNDEKMTVEQFAEWLEHLVKNRQSFLTKFDVELSDDEFHEALKEA
jgi:hypothetical protein